MLLREGSGDKVLSDKGLFSTTRPKKRKGESVFIQPFSANDGARQSMDTFEEMLKKKKH